MTNKSLAFRKNEKGIYQGKIPDKYKRIIPYIKGNTVLEIGSAEGVLSLLLAQEKDKVIAVERHKDRYEEALRLKEAWNKLGYKVDNCHFIHGDIRDNFHLLEGIDTVIAVRVIYYFGKNLNNIFLNFFKRCKFIVLVGNINRSKKYQQGEYIGNIGKDNYYASSKGMIEILKTHRYGIHQSVLEDSNLDPIIIGKKTIQKPSTMPDYRLKESVFPYLKKFDLIKEQNDIIITDYKDITLPIDEVLRKSWNVIEPCHVALLNLYKKKGKNYDYTTTNYWNRFVINKIKIEKIKEKMYGFFDLFDRIKKEGFRADKKNPITVCDLKGIMTDKFIEKKWRYHRCNGTHRLSIAKILGIKEVPILLMTIKLMDILKETKNEL